MSADGCTVAGAMGLIRAWAREVTPMRAAWMLRIFAASADRSAAIDGGRGRREAAIEARRAAALYRVAAARLEAGPKLRPEEVDTVLLLALGDELAGELLGRREVES